MKGWMVYSIVVTVILVAVVSVAAGFVLSNALDDDSEDVAQATEQPTREPTEQPTARPTASPYVPRLTGTEAAAKAKDYWFSDATTQEQRALAAQFDCRTEDFNQRDRTWIVVCLHPSVEVLVGVDDRTGEVTILGNP